MELDEVKKEVKSAIEPLMQAWEAFKDSNDARISEVEKKGAADPLLNEKVQRIESTLSAYEGLNQKLTMAEQQAKAAKEATDRMEVALARIPKGAAEKPTDIKARVNDWARAVVNVHTVGIPNLSQDEAKVLMDVQSEAKALGISPDTAGGYLAPTEYVREILKTVTEMSPIRQLARVRTTALKAIEIPKRTGQFAAQWVSEAGTRSETTGLAYGMETLTAYEMYALVDISNQMLEDSAFDMESEIRTEATEQFAVAEGTAFVSGNGVGKPEGFMTNGDISSSNSGTAATIADANGVADGLLSVKYSLKTAYAANAVWVMNRTTMGSVRKLKDADKNYIWMPGIAQGRPNTIDGDPYVEVPDMPNEGANLFPIAYGDFRRGYMILDRIAMEMLRDQYTQATTGRVRFIFRRRLGGQVIMPEAIKKLKCST